MFIFWFFGLFDMLDIVFVVNCSVDCFIVIINIVFICVRIELNVNFICGFDSLKIFLNENELVVVNCLFRRCIMVILVCVMLSLWLNIMWNGKVL